MVLCLPGALGHSASFWLSELTHHRIRRKAPAQLHGSKGEERNTACFDVAYFIRLAVPSHRTITEVPGSGNLDLGWSSPLSHILVHFNVWVY